MVNYPSYIFLQVMCFLSGVYNSLAATTFPISGSQLMEVGGTTMGKSRDATVITIAVNYIQYI